MLFLTFYYNIHGILNLQSIVQLNELEYFRVRGTNDADLSIAPIRGNGIAPSRRMVQDGASPKYVENLGRLGAGVSFDRSGGISVGVSSLLCNSRSVLYVNVVEPLLRVLFATKGYALLHSACLAADGAGWLISAPPDTGKTTTVLRMLREGAFTFLSDDMTITDENGIAYCFPKPLTISAHTYGSIVNNHKKELGEFSLRLRGYAHSRMGRKIMRLIGKSSLVPILSLNAYAQYVVRPPKMKIEDLLEEVQISSRVRIRSLHFLREGPNQMRWMHTEEAVRELMHNSEDAFSFPPYDSIFPALKINGMIFADVIKIEEAILSRALSGVPCFMLDSRRHSWSEMLLENEEEPLQTELETKTR